MASSSGLRRPEAGGKRRRLVRGRHGATPRHTLLGARTRHISVLRSDKKRRLLDFISRRGRSPPRAPSALRRERRRRRGGPKTVFRVIRSTRTAQQVCSLALLAAGVVMAHAPSCCRLWAERPLDSASLSFVRVAAELIVQARRSWWPGHELSRLRWGGLRWTWQQQDREVATA